MVHGEAMDWAVAITSSSQAAEKLSDAGLVCFNPKMIRRSVIRGRHVETPVPMFPGYLFVIVGQAWSLVRRTPGVLGFLRGAGLLPALLPEAVVQGIRSRCDRDGICRDGAFAEGDRVRFLRGHLADLVGTYESAERDGATICVPLLGREVRVHVPFGDFGPYPS